MAYVSQSRVDQLDPENTVYQEIAEGEDEIVVGEDRISLRVYTAAVRIS